jgi:hypothetical protein
LFSPRLRQDFGKTGRALGLKPGGNDKIPEHEKLRPRYARFADEAPAPHEINGEVKGGGRGVRPPRVVNVRKNLRPGASGERIGAPDAGLQEFAQLTINGKVRQSNSL